MFNNTGMVQYDGITMIRQQERNIENVAEWLIVQVSLKSVVVGWQYIRFSSESTFSFASRT